jgi:hypothetical protein
MSKTDPVARAALLDRELERLNQELAVLNRQWDQKYRLGLFAVLAIPVAYWGLAYSVIVILCTPALIATQAYLIGVRRAECLELIGEAKRELATLRKKSSPAKASEPKASADPAAKPSAEPAKASDDAAKPSDDAA